MLPWILGALLFAQLLLGWWEFGGHSRAARQHNKHKPTNQPDPGLRADKAPWTYVV